MVLFKQGAQGIADKGNEIYGWGYVYSIVPVDEILNERGMTMTRAEKTSVFRKYAQAALIKEYGFAPPLKDIVIREAIFDVILPQYVRFEVGGHEYSYDGITLDKLN